MAQKLICSACGHVGSSKTAVKGNILIEIILWLFFIIPGLIYSIWRSSSRYKKCVVCGSTNLVPVDTPVGRKMLAEQGKTIEEVVGESGKQKKSVGKKILIIAVIIFLFIGFMVTLASMSS